jgi:hypothetical protein
MIRNRFFYRPVLLAALLMSLMSSARPCSWAIGYFHQVTCLRGTLVGMNRGWPRWLRQRVVRDNVNARLYEYRWPIHNPAEMPLVKAIKTDKNGWFDFGELPKGHYTLVIDWPSGYADAFDVEITTLAKPTTSVKIDVSPVYPDCTGGHEFLSFTN